MLKMPLQNGSSQFELTKEELESLVIPQLGSDVKVKDFTAKALTEPGENYGSTILAVELHIQQGDDNYVLPLIAKLVPQSQFLREAFVIETTFNKEVSAYKFVSPEYKNLQKENNVPMNRFVDIFPKFYGARTNKQGNLYEKADDTAVLLLENLKLSGYVTGDRLLGLSLECMKFGVSKLAKFHALSVALKLLKPSIFQKTVMKACESFIPGGVNDPDVAEKWINSGIESVKTIPECVPYLARIERALREEMKWKQNPALHVAKEPFATFVHNDFWVNNMMFTFENGVQNDNESTNYATPTDMKIVDFQITLYSSPVRDLIFFIYSSAADGVIENHYADLIRIYHNEFVDCLNDVGCDINPFSFDNFQEELNEFAPLEFSHILYMHKFISAEKSKVPDLTNCGVDEIIQNNYGGKVYEKRLNFLIQDFVQKGWL